MAAKQVAMIVTNPFKPDERVRREASVLASLGFSVTLYAWDREGSYPISEQISGFSVRRIRLRSRYASTAAVLATLPVFCAAAFVRILISDARIVHCHDFDTLAIGVMMKALKKVKLVYDAHEDYSSMVSDYVPSPIRPIITIMDRLLSRKADAVLTVSEPLAQKIANPNIYVIRNSPEDATIEPQRTSTGKAVWPPGFRVFCYGFLGNDRGIQTVLRIASENPNLSLVVAGDGPRAMAVKQAAARFSNVRYIGYLSVDRIRRVLTECQLVYAMYDPRIENNRFAAPNKLYEAMMFGKPLLVAKGCYMGQVVLRERCGVLASYDNLSDVLEAIVKLQRDRHLADLLGGNGKTAFYERYQWKFSARSLQECYDSITAETNQRRDQSRA